MSAPPSLIGTTLDAYEIHALLGSGGLAAVYRGFDVNPHRSVAVKVLSTTLAADSAYVARFRREAWLIANLRQYTWIDHLLRRPSRAAGRGRYIADAGIRKASSRAITRRCGTPSNS